MAKGPTSLNDCDLFATQWRHYSFNLKTGVTLDDAMAPEFWADIGKKMRPWDRITLQGADPVKFIAEAVVLQAGHGFAKLKLLAMHDLTDGAVAAEAVDFDASEFKIKHTGFGKWQVIRASDDRSLRDGFGSKEEAQLWALNHQRAVLA